MYHDTIWETTSFCMYFQGHEQNFAGGIDKLLLAAQQLEAAPPSPPQPQNPTGKNG